MSAPAHKVILASAGTGKTFRLTHRYLSLLARGVSPERILATTFTRKAAGEILDRILERLVEAAGDPGKLADLNRHLEGATLTQAECRSLLAGLVRSLHRVEVRTLDSFFAHLLRLYALDLGLPADWRIGEEQEDLRVRSDTVMAAVEAGERGELLEVVQAVQGGVLGRSVHQQLLDKLKDFLPPHLESPREAWERVQPPAGLEPAELEDLVGEIQALDLPRNKGNGKENHHWVQAVQGLVQAVVDQDWARLLSVGLVEKVLEGAQQFSKHDIRVEFRRPVLDLARHAASRLLAQLDRRNRGTWQWLASFDAAYQARKAASRSYRFEDIPRHLAPSWEAAGESPATGRQDLAFRLDGPLDHLLLDEFQDTSIAQWRVLEPLVERTVRPGRKDRSFFCVGDVKQSVYRWRQAEPDLLAGLPARLPHAETESLEVSYRSSPVIVGTVNRIFSSIDGNPAWKDDPDLVEAAHAWQDRFSEHRTALEDLPGAAHLVEMAPEEDLPARVAELVQGILEQAPGCEVGVLLRRTRFIPAILHALLAQGIRASGEGGNPLTDSRAVSAALSALRLADHPADSAAAFHVATSPLGAVLGLAPGASAAEVAAVAAQLRHSLLASGYGPWLETLRPAVEASFDSWERKRFGQLTDLALLHRGRETLRPAGFAELLAAQKVEDPESSAVRVMTVHAAKGLEFDAVVLADLDSRLVPRNPPLLCRRGSLTGPFEVVTHYPRKVLQGFQPLLAEMDRDQRRREIEEQLSVLYVAVTRARQALWMLVEHRDPDKDPATSAAGLLRGALAAGQGADGTLWRHPDSTEDWWGGEAPGVDQEAPPAPEIQLAASTRPRELPRFAPSGQEGGGRVPVARVLGGKASVAALQRGSVLHRWFQEVEWLEDFELDEETLVAVAAEAGFGALDLGPLVAGFRAVLQSRSVRECLSRQAREQDLGSPLVVWRERPFALLLEDASGRPAFWSGSFDRVVLRAGANGHEAAEILDFKTDRATEDRPVAALVEWYRPQMEAYRQALARITGLEEAAVACRLLFVNEDRVCPV